MIFILLSAFKGDTSTPSTKGRSAGYGRSEEKIERGGNGLGTVRIENVGGVRTITLARVEKWPAPPKCHQSKAKPTPNSVWPTEMVPQMPVRHICRHSPVSGHWIPDYLRALGPAQETSNFC